MQDRHLRCVSRLVLDLALTLSRNQSSSMARQFDHEKLKVYQAAIQFVAWSTELAAQIRSKAAVKDQLDRASTSIPVNIAEGNGKFAIKDRCRFLDFPPSSALECAACLDVLVAKRLSDKRAVRPGKEQLFEIVLMLMGLIQSLTSRISEDVGDIFGFG
jgi:four helix bundle protein